MIVCRSTEQEGSGVEGHRARAKGDGGLATALYFRRCDGDFKNVLGEKLAIVA